MAFQDDIAAAVDAFGVKNIGLVWAIGLMNWDSAEQRDEFLRAASKNYQE